MVQVSELRKMSDSTLISIYKSLNNWEWPEALGSEPDNWADMPNYKKLHMDECLTKGDVIRPYMKAIQQRIPHETIYSASKIIKSKQGGR